jgi:hypothetical protein
MTVFPFPNNLQELNEYYQTKIREKESGKANFQNLITNLVNPSG